MVGFVEGVRAPKKIVIVFNPFFYERKVSGAILLRLFFFRVLPRGKEKKIEGRRSVK